MSHLHGLQSGTRDGVGSAQLYLRGGRPLPAKRPHEVPEVNLDVFYNSQITREVRDVIKDKVLAEAKNNLGMASTFSLIEFVKENFDDLVKDQPDPEVLKQQMAEMKLENADDKKDQLTKAQKRRIWDKVEAGKGGQVERGNDWVDIVKHLSQMGSETDL
ncbi:hypothetical protein L596_025595 [Steinernema carpocapsae]|uniref:RWD domain-containing protein n=1 Tax=Steinernema carpocapsae TaxID=34508 RepID=A0A4U5M886_STECR|nr:hypothetical protein L596_025595 [Steinernema carpocapsae]